MTDEKELFKDVPTFSEALGNLVKFTTEALKTLDKSSPLYVQGDKALNDITLAALRNLIDGAKQQREPVPNAADIERQLRGHDPYSRS